jgi:hypothetical protein
MLEGLSYSEKLLLGYFATQDTDNILPADIVARISKVDKGFVGGSLHLQLVNKTLLERGAYNFTYRELMYRISPNVMVKVLEWLYDTDEGNSILKVLCEVFKYFQMNQKPIQIALCEYIRSNYRNTSEASIIFGADVPYLQPIINDDKYMALLSHITEASFVELVKNVLKLCYEGEMFIESGYIYAPYLPLFASQLLVDADFKAQRGFCTLYAKKPVNPYMYHRIDLIDNTQVTADGE